MKSKRRVSTLFLAGMGIAVLWIGGTQYYRTHDVGLLDFGKGEIRQISRRSGALTANFSGRVGSGASSLEYSINNGAWIPVDLSSKAFDQETVTLQVPRSLILGGQQLNHVFVRGSTWLKETEAEFPVRFVYDDAPPALPLVWSAAKGRTESDHGLWVQQARDGDPLIQPVPGTEGYDRILLLSGAFAGARRIRARIVYLQGSLPHPGMLHGYGLIPLWGGNVDEDGVCPRRGWRYGLCWFYSAEQGYGIEFSNKPGAQEHDTVNRYAAFEPQPGRVERILIEAWPTQDEGAFSGWHIRAKRWFEDEQEPQAWLQFSDSGGKRLPEQEYAVAFLAHRCSAGIFEARIEKLSR
jgi:hypothetical protein